MQGWPDFRPAAEDLPRLFNGKNIGLIVGVRSGSVVDMDLDCAEAIALADLYRPPTGAEFSRRTKPRSHRLYVAPGATFEAFADPLLDGKNTLLELPADGRTGGAHLTVLPPSITGGEQREWHSDVIAPAVRAAIIFGAPTLRRISDIPPRPWAFGRRDARRRGPREIRGRPES
jgi:hypothetical protein